jgi:hypothetical protein
MLDNIDIQSEEKTMREEREVANMAALVDRAWGGANFNDNKSVVYFFLVW